MNGAGLAGLYGCLLPHLGLWEAASESFLGLRDVKITTSREGEPGEWKRGGGAGELVPLNRLALALITNIL